MHNDDHRSRGRNCGDQTVWPRETKNACLFCCFHVNQKTCWYTRKHKMCVWLARKLFFLPNFNQMSDLGAMIKHEDNIQHNGDLLHENWKSFVVRQVQTKGTC